ncbi:MAG TPA: cbb3-type cytochrome c oxidase subunit I, partial [Ferruginibacter sp.]|nr:cbb3-type cytochrome c oxidase subunit I [Ferruginibacter sp.]
DHKKIGIMYIVLGLVMLARGVIEGVVMRGHQAAALQGGFLSSEHFGELFTTHGTIMILFVAVPLVVGFINIIVPLQIGARDMASPLLNAMSYWFFFLAGVVLLLSLFLSTGPFSGGWTAYPPLSALGQASDGSKAGMTMWIVAMSLFVVSSLLGGINYITTILNLRTKGMNMWRMPLTIWAIFITAILGVLSFPVLFSGLLLLMFDRSLGTSFYLSEIVVGGQILDRIGGSPVLFQHLFWFLGHPEVYIIILPAMGIVSEVLSVHARKPIFGYRAMVYSILAIAFLSFIVWAHHMFMAGVNPFISNFFVVFTLIIAVPSAIKVFNWISTVYGSNFRFNSA